MAATRPRGAGGREWSRTSIQLAYQGEVELQAQEAAAGQVEVPAAAAVESAPA